MSVPRGPMLATKGDRVPSGPAWAHEVKWDGIRALVEVADGVVHVRTRTGRDIGTAFPELAGLAGAGRDLLLDGELVTLGSGVPTLLGLADRIHVVGATRAAALARSNPATLLVFDLLRLDDRDLTGEPWQARRDLLEGLGLADVAWQVPATYDDGVLLLESARRQGFEGIVSKKRTSRYHPGSRSRDWLKFPIRPTGSFVVGGYRFETDSETRIGALYLGVPVPEGLEYRGRVGSGVAGKAQALLGGLLPGLRRDTSPFVAMPRLDAVGGVWVEPVLVVDVEFLMLTRDHRLRQPSYRGIRSDLTPADVRDAQSADEGEPT